ncbi:MAG: preprotein translocase subunit SecE [Acidipropionibacterium jensenii]|nr:preprotein translocase subunit SecE [Acidipropionibacterium jensenii]
MTDERHPHGDEGESPSSDGKLSPRGEDLASGKLPGTDDLEIADDQAEELENADDTVDDTPDKGDPADVVIDDPQQLDSAERAARKARSSRPVRRKAAASRTAKADDTESDDTEKAAASAKAEKSGDGSEHKPVRTLTQAPVRRRSSSAEDGKSGKKRTTPVMFVRQSAGELRKVRWPSGSETSQYFIVVLVFVLVIIAYVGGLDALFAKALLKFLG